MLTWLTVAAGVLCMLWAAAQLRVTFVYLGVVPSAVVRHGGAALVHSALQDALLFLSLGLVCFLVRWPRLVTYAIALLLLKAVVNSTLAVLAVGRFGVGELTAKRRVRQALLELVPLTVYAIGFAISAHFLGL